MKYAGNVCRHIKGSMQEIKKKGKQEIQKKGMQEI